MRLAHGGGEAVEPELLVFGVAACALAFILHRREDADAKAALVTLVVGIALLFGAFAVPRA
ncbi:MAG TPA: hypothetical protein VG929_10255 [Actinomycetota bacterium]|nr:hypothetical protein [Actinomycetota bacterium]